MKLDINDPRLSAYVLGELSPEESKEIEAALSDPQNKEARELVAGIQDTSSQLTDALASESGPGLTEEQRARLKEVTSQTGEKKKKSFWGWKLGFGLGLAGVSAALLLLVVVPTMEMSGDLRYKGQPSDERPAAGIVSASQARPGKSHAVHVITKNDAFSDKTKSSKRWAKTEEDEDEQGFHTEAYDHIQDNPFRMVAEHPLSTFSIDVDTASYANMRRFLQMGRMPPKDAVRIEEMINYFDYDYPTPTGRHPFSVNLEVAQSLWNPRHRLVRIGLKGYELKERPASNLVFLIDVSGSMRSQNKLPLLKESMKMLVRGLGEESRVALVVYAGAAGLVLDSTPCDREQDILTALSRLKAGGSTHGSAGIKLAYQVARDNFIKGGNNRVILASDGDFNVGTTSRGELVRLIEKKAKQGVFLTVLGFGMGNYKDATLEQLADKGNGNYAYIDNLNEAKKVLVNQLTGTLFTIAKDVKIQVEFNPARVQAYRLVGYENRMLRKEDFNDDTKDAGEIGAGHTVTALYEVVPPGEKIDVPGVDPLKYQKQTESKTDPTHSGELLTVKLRYKAPDGDKSKLMVEPLHDSERSFARASRDFQFAASVAGFGMLLRDSKYKGSASWEQVFEIADANVGRDTHGYRREFIELVKTARGLNSARER